MEDVCKNRKIEFYLPKKHYYKSLLFAPLLFITLNATAPEAQVAAILSVKPVAPYERLIKAISWVECFGDTLAYNRREQAVGAFQIRPVRLRDYNKRTGNNYKLKECYSFALSKKIFLYYAEKIGYKDYEAIARSWNGSGKKTNDYWRKVRKYL